MAALTTGTFASADGKHQLAYSRWVEGTPKAIFQICHGMAEYIARYDAFARFLARNGFAVYGCDHLGHGLNVTEDGTGFFADKDGYEIITADQHALTQLAKAENPGIPMVLFGHSMGSSVVRYYASKWSEDIDALIFSGPSGPNPAVGAGLTVVGLLSAIKGEKHRSNLVNAMAFGSYLKRCDEKRTVFDWLSVEQSNVDAYVKDELCGFTFTLSAFRDLFMLIKSINSKDGVVSVRHDLPVFILTGAEDPVSAYGEGSRQVTGAFKETGVTDVTEKEYEGMRHEILNETGKAAVYSDILSWCIEKLAL